MELATNQFNKGLQMDTNPMVLGSDTLTDCLNGTLITMNGNEVILLNDMGNRRVSNAFLPPGYEPVGMKEYGGIIYVAAYNPITNKSLIGSFPSPLRKIDSLNGDLKSLSINLNEIFFKEEVNTSTDPNLKDSNENKILLLNSDSFMYPLTNNVLIHSGDKFVVYAPGLSLLKGLISNYDNIEENSGKIFSPKNRKYTLLLGVLNSLNEFVDITKTLERWEKVGDNWEIISNNSKNSEEFRFNKGYFIPDGFTDKLAGLTIDDANLLLERLKLSTNTYSYKLVGPLYLKVIYNHIQNFSYNIDADISDIKVGKGGILYKELELTIEGYITYNCPDTKTSGNYTLALSEKYYTYDEVPPEDFFGFHLIGYEEWGGDYGLTEQDTQSSTYDPISNTYSVKITKKYLIRLSPDKEVFPYTIGVFADYTYTNNPNERNPIYLKDCSSSGKIDLSLLKSNRVFLKEWRFFNNVELKKTTLLYNFNSYPKKDLYFENLKFHFEEIVKEGEDPSTFEYSFKSLNNGRAIQVLDWENKIKERAAYKVSISYDIISKNTSEIIEEGTVSEDILRWFLSTELLNEFYPLSKEVLDYCDKEYSTMEFKNKFIVSRSVSSSLSSEEYETRGEESEGALLGTTSDISYNIGKGQAMTAEIELETSLNNNSLLPNFVDYQNNSYILNVEGFHFGDRYVKRGNSDWDGLPVSREDLSGDTTIYSDFGELPLISISNSIFESNSKLKLGLLYICYNYYWGRGLRVSVLNCFKRFLSELGSYLPRSGYYAGVLPKTTYTGASITEKSIKLYYNLLNYTPSTSGEYAALSTSDITLYWMANAYTVGPGTASVRIINRLEEAFDLHSHEYQVFLLLFPPDSIYSPREKDNCRIWWKTSDGNWAFSTNTLSKETWERYLSGENVESEFKKLLNLKKDWIFSSYIALQDSEIYAAKLNNCMYTNEYSIPLSLDLTCNFLGTFNTKDYGNLKFILNDEPSEINLPIREQLSYSRTFLESIELFDIDDVSNIYWDGSIIKFRDYRGNTLNPTKIYYLENGELVPALDSPKLTLVTVGNRRVPQLSSYTVESSIDVVDIDRDVYPNFSETSSRLNYNNIRKIPDEV